MSAEKYLGPGMPILLKAQITYSRNSYKQKAKQKRIYGSDLQYVRKTMQST